MWRCHKIQGNFYFVRLKKKIDKNTNCQFCSSLSSKIYTQNLSCLSYPSLASNIIKSKYTSDKNQVSEFLSWISFLFDYFDQHKIHQKQTSFSQIPFCLPKQEKQTNKQKGKYGNDVKIFLLSSFFNRFIKAIPMLA